MFFLLITITTELMFNSVKLLKYIYSLKKNIKKLKGYTFIAFFFFFYQSLCGFYGKTDVLMLYIFYQNI